MSSKKPSSSSKLPWILVAALLLTLATGGGWFWYSSAVAAPVAADAAAAETDQTSPRKPAIYFALDPAFVVNLADTNAVRYLQADVQLMTRDDATAKAMELHAPAIRNRLLLLFGQYSADQLAQRSAKERLQKTAADEVRTLLKTEATASKVEAVYFTSFVTQ